MPTIAVTDRGATIIGSGRRTTTWGAAFVNGTQLRYLDFLDVYFTKDVCHPSENIPPAIACVEEIGGSGRTLVEAIVVGYEAQTRLCDAFAFPAINLHYGSAAGFVVPLVAGKAWRQSAEVMAHGCVLGGSRHLTLNSLLAGDLRHGSNSRAPDDFREMGSGQITPSFQAVMSLIGTSATSGNDGVEFPIRG